MLRILVVEDFAPFRRLVCMALQRSEFETTEAADGLEGIQKAEQLQPDLILLDINLPKLHGFEVAQRIRHLAPRARLIFLSQESSPDIVRKALRLGAHGYVHKLSAATDLLPAIEAVLEGRRFVSRSTGYTEPAGVAHSPARHELLFCPDETALIDVLARYVVAVLNAANAVIVVVRESDRNRLLQQLRTQDVDIDGAVEHGTFRALDDNGLDVARLVEAIDGARDAATRAGNAHPRIALCGNHSGRLWADGRTEEALQLEQACRALPQDLDILCVYPVPHDKDDEALTRVCAAHTAVLGG